MSWIHDRDLGPVPVGKRGGWMFADREVGRGGRGWAGGGDRGWRCRGAVAVVEMRHGDGGGIAALQGLHGVGMIVREGITMGTFTEQQRRAIAATGEVLVMAGAGAGKTSTLVARVLDRVTSGLGRVSLDRVLVVTFSEAAAAEMRQRLQRALEARLAEAPGDAWLEEQVALLETSMVSTLHGFCLRLIREHFHELGLDPQFAVQDPLQTRILEGQVMGEVFREGYAGTGSEAERVRDFLRRHGADGDGGLRELVLRIHDYARSLPEGVRWIRRVRERCGVGEAREWRGLVMEGVRRWAGGWRGYAERLAGVIPENFAATESARELGRAGALEWAGLAGWLESLARAGDRGRFEKWQPGYRKVQAWRGPLEDLFEEVEELRSMLVAEEGGGDPLLEDWGWARGDMEVVLGLAERFEGAFRAARRASAVVDFADLEQMALQLLWDEEGGRPTRLAESWRERIEQVMVDEYQDINGAQDRILGCLGREGAGANRFFVGDVKQSIYRFRLAAPAIFQRYAREWRGGGEGRSVIALTENFRSHEAIIGFVNEVFGRVMLGGVGGVEYDAEARLVFGAAESRGEQRAAPEGRVEMHLVVREDGSEGEGFGGEERGVGGWGDLDIEERQALVAAGRLRELHESGCEVWDAAAGEMRRVGWRDMVVLHPAPGPVSERWARSFARMGVPLDARRGGFFEALEVADLVNVARMLDNPLQDLPVLAVLRSPMVGLGVEELAAVRLVDRVGRYWEAVEKCVAGGSGVEVGAEGSGVRSALESARVRLERFVRGFRRWQVLARHGSVTRCLEAVLEETAYEHWLRAQPRAEARLANVRRLLVLTRQFDQARRRGLYRFLRFVEQQAGTGETMDSAPAASGESVRMLSMHQSKGLEFPVVVVAGVGRKFNLRDLREDWLLDEQYGLCPPVLPPGRARGYPSLPKWFSMRRQLAEAVGEQARLFYVACTRAVDRLVLVGAVKPKAMEGWNDREGWFTEREAVRVSEPMGWLGPLLPALTGNARWMDSETGRGRWLDWRLHRALSEPGTREGADSAGPGWGSGLGEAPTAGEVELMRERLAWRYAWQPCTETPAKTAVTALRRAWQVDEEASTGPWGGSMRSGEGRGEASGEGVGVVGAPEAVARGLAHHTYLQLLDLRGPLTPEYLAGERDRLVREGWLEAESAVWVDVEGVAEFWRSEVGVALRGQVERIQRELPFTVRLSRAEAVGLGAPGGSEGFAADDFQVVQGVADLVLLGEEEVWVVDFKTDRVTRGEAEARGRSYAAQLRLYAHALSRIYGRPVTRQLLWFIQPRCLVEISGGGSPARTVGSAR